MKVISSKFFERVKIVFVILTCATLYMDLPNKKMSNEEKNVNFGLNCLTFAFFFV